MTYVQSYKDLIVWQKAMLLVKEVYILTRLLPKEEMYGLSSQKRRAAVSVPSNIAEGYKRQHLGEYIQFLNIADGSNAELETQMLIVKDIYPTIKTDEAIKLQVEVQKMLVVIISKLNMKRSPLNASR